MGRAFNGVNMQFVIMTHEVDERPEAQEKAEQYWAAWRAYGQALSEADVLVALNGLEPRSTADTPRLQEGAPRVRVGPDTYPGGLPGRYFILNVADLDEAVDWASRCPAAAKGTVEVRPVRLLG
jgi:hypothetical protein